MEQITITILYPAKNDPIEIMLPRDILFCDIIDQLINYEYSNNENVINYGGILGYSIKSELYTGDKTIELDNSKASKETRVKDGIITIFKIDPKQRRI